MLNLIRMNLYRFFKEKGYIALIIIMLCTVLISSIAIELNTSEAVVTEYVDENGSTVRSVEWSNEETGDSVKVSSEADISFGQLFIEIMGGGVLVMIVGIFAIIYSDNERKFGFVKNLTVRKSERVAVFAAKAVPVFLFTLFTMIAAMIGIYLGSLLIAPVPFGDLNQFMAYFGVQLLLSTAYGIFSLALYELIRREVVTVIIIIFSSLGLVSQLVQLLEAGLVEIGLCSEAFMEKFEISQHFLEVRSSAIQLGDVSGGRPCAVIIAIIGMAVYLVAGMILYRKKDVV